jgi:hypothetical protein
MILFSYRLRKAIMCEANGHTHFLFGQMVKTTCPQKRKEVQKYFNLIRIMTYEAVESDGPQEESKFVINLQSETEAYKHPHHIGITVKIKILCHIIN